MIEAKNISYSINNNDILLPTSCQILNGKITTILGANGAGKSTLLQCLTNSIKPKTGEITLNNKNLEDFSLQELATQRAVLSQINSIDFPFSVFEIIMLGREPYTHNTSHSENEKIAEKFLNLLKIKHLKNRKINTLSGGEQQLTHIARTLAQIENQKDAYLFCDEPLNNLDLKYQYIFLELLKELKVKFNWGITLILHNLSLAKLYSDNIILMKNGQCLQGATAKVLTKENISSTFDISEKVSQKMIFL